MKIFYLCSLLIFIVGTWATMILISTSQHSLLISHYVYSSQVAIQLPKSVTEDSITSVLYDTMYNREQNVTTDYLNVNVTDSLTSLQNELNATIHTPIQKASYLLAMVYAEQLNSATHHYASLVNIAADWMMKSIEPMIAKSRLYGLQCLYNPNINENFYHYGQFFNFGQVSQRLNRCLASGNVSVITSRADFLSGSHRDIVVVHFVHKKPLPVISNCVGIPNNKPYLQKLHYTGENFADCTKVAGETGMLASVEKMLNDELKGNGMGVHETFHVSKVICVDAFQQVSIPKLKEAIQSHGKTSSVVFIHWQGERTAISLSGNERSRRCLLNRIEHSEEVIKAASLFIDSLNLKRPFLSVHIRSERIIHSNSLHSGYQECCMRRLHSLIEEIMKKHELLSVLLVRDYGEYGTDSCFYGDHTKPHWFCKDLSDHMMKEIGEWGIHYSSFDPSKFQSVKNSGFVSLVETNVLLQGEVLLTVGYGSFQSQLIGRFIDQNPFKINAQLQTYSICHCYKNDKEDLRGLLTSNSCESLIP